jgi:hypothetical protein
MILEAVIHGQRSVDFNCNSSEGHKWYAIVVGSRAGRRRRQKNMKSSKELIFFPII